MCHQGNLIEIQHVGQADDADDADDDAAFDKIQQTTFQVFFFFFKKGLFKGILEKLTSVAAVFECHMLLFLQLCKLRDV